MNWAKESEKKADLNKDGVNVQSKPDSRFGTERIVSDQYVKERRGECEIFFFDMR